MDKFDKIMFDDVLFGTTKSGNLNQVGDFDLSKVEVITKKSNPAVINQGPIL